MVALSGGMDSCVAAARAAMRHDLALLHVGYGQRTERRERRSFLDLADYYRVPEDRRLIVPAPHYGRLGGSSLTDAGMEIPRGRQGGRGVPTTYVPFRNAFILCVAVSWAEVIGAGRVFVGVTEPDGSGYPDCRPAFIEAFNRLIAAGTRLETSIIVEAPLIRMTKKEIVEEGLSLGAPLHLTWSCYVSTGPKACGVCESCILRLKGFSGAGVKDPIPY